MLIRSHTRRTVGGTTSTRTAVSETVGRSGVDRRRKLSEKVGLPGNHLDNIHWMKHNLYGHGQKLYRSTRGHSSRSSAMPVSWTGAASVTLAYSWITAARKVAGTEWRVRQERLEVSLRGQAEEDEGVGISGGFNGTRWIDKRSGFG